MSKNDIERLRQNTLFSDAAAIILKQKYKDTRKKIRRFLEDSSVENLHALRIAVRRLRYSLENFRSCFSKADYRKNIGSLKNLQDLIGVGRDLDMLKDMVSNIASESKIPVPASFFDNLTGKKEIALQEIKLELLKFLHNKSIKLFFTDKKEE